MGHGKSSRRKQSRKALDDKTGDAPAKHRNHSFAGLRQQLQQHRHAQQTTAPAKQTPAPKSSANDQDDVHKQLAEECALFLRSVGAVTPIRADPRVEPEQRRPPPVPRPLTISDDEPASRPRQPLDPLAEAYLGVIPLRDSGRIEPLPRRHSFQAETRAETTASGLRPAGLLLPAELDRLPAAELFQQLTAGTHQLDDSGRVELSPAPPPPLPLQREEDERAAMQETMSHPISIEDRLDMGDEAHFLRSGLPKRVLTDLRRGRWVLQAELDLHGLVRDEARAAIARFVQQGLQQGWRCVRVIHGKGHGSPGKLSILKQLSRGWLAQREEILAFCEANPRDGGSGALYVLLRAAHSKPRQDL